MPNANFGQRLHLTREGPEVLHVQVVACIHAQAQRMGEGRRLGEGFCCLVAHLGVSHGEGFGVQLDAVGACFRGSFDFSAVVFHENGRSNARLAKGAQHVL